MTSNTSVSEINQKREHIFLDSTDPTNQVYLHDSTSPTFIKLPFPPSIDPYKLISDRNSGSNMSRIPARTPNAFILYRKVFIESARKEGYHLPMTVISSMASKSWKHESDIVKEEYRRISKQAFEIRKQLLPKTDKKKKRETWNFVSFSKKSDSSNKSNKIEMKISGNHQNEDIQRDIQQRGIQQRGVQQRGIQQRGIQQQEIQQKELDSFNSNLDTPSVESNNFDNENNPYIKEHLPNSNYQMYNQKSFNFIDSYISHNNNKNIEFEEINDSLSHSNVTNIYDTNNQHQLNINHDDEYTNSTVDSMNISLMQNSHYNNNYHTYYI